MDSGPVKLKHCGGCDRDLSRSHFWEYTDKRRTPHKKRLTSRCKKCMGKAVKKYYRNNAAFRADQLRKRANRYERDKQYPLFRRLVRERGRVTDYKEAIRHHIERTEHYERECLAAIKRRDRLAAEWKQALAVINAKDKRAAA